MFESGFAVRYTGGSRRTLPSSPGHQTTTHASRGRRRLITGEAVGVIGVWIPGSLAAGQTVAFCAEDQERGLLFLTSMQFCNGRRPSDVVKRHDHKRPKNNGKIRRRGDIEKGIGRLTGTLRPTPSACA